MTYENRVIQASGFIGPIPSSISSLTNLTELLVPFISICLPVYKSYIRNYVSHIHGLTLIAGELLTWMDLNHSFLNLIIWKVWTACELLLLWITSLAAPKVFANLGIGVSFTGSCGTAILVDNYLNILAT